jgi:hypothetical protein
MKIPDPPSTPIDTNATEVVQRTDWFVLTPLPIPVGREYLVDARASIFKVVTCARCQHGYTYEMVRSEPGGGPDDTRARATAQSALRVALAKGCDPVPCPECGTYQPDMVRQLQNRHRSELFTAGALLLVVAVVVLATHLFGWIGRGWLRWAVLATTGFTGAGLIAVKSYLGSRYNPNVQPDVERRKQIGRQRVAAAEQAARQAASQSPSLRGVEAIRAEPGAATDPPPSL